jgi:hypothetical protein
MFKFFLLWTAITSISLVVCYTIDVATRKEVTTWSKRITAIGITAAVFLSIIVFLEGNL